MTWRCSVPPAPLPPPPPWCLRHPLPPPRGRASSAGACPADGHAERASAFRSYLTGWTSAAHAARDDVGRAPQRTDCCSGGATVTMRPNDRVRWMRRRWPGYAPWRVRAVKVGFTFADEATWRACELHKRVQSRIAALLYVCWRREIERKSTQLQCPTTTTSLPRSPSDSRRCRRQVTCAPEPRM